MGTELAMVGIAMGVVGGAGSAYGQFQAGQAQRRASNYQAKLDRIRAADAEKEGAIEQRQSDIAFGQQVGKSITTLANRGMMIGEGLAADFQSDAAAEHGAEKAIIARNTRMKEFGFMANASMHNYEGRMAARAGTLGATGTMLSMYGNAFSAASSLGPSPELTGNGSVEPDGSFSEAQARFDYENNLWG